MKSSKIAFILAVIILTTSQLNAQVPEDNFNRAYVYGEKNMFKEAVMEYNKALSFNPDNEMAMRIYFNLGIVYDKLHQKDKAIESFRQVLTLNPDLFIVRMNLANALFGLENFDEAAVHYEKALEIDPDYSKKYVIYYNLALCYKNTNKFNESLNYSNKILEADPEKVEALKLVAENCINLEKYEEAEKCLNELESKGVSQKELFLLLQKKKQLK